MKKIFRFLLILTAGVLVAASGVRAQYAPEATGARIAEIKVLGAQRIEPSTVLAYMDVRVGDSMTQETLDRGLKSLFATGLFSDVTLNQRGQVLEVNLVENPVISEIAFEGNDKIKKEELQAEVQLKPRDVFSRTRVQADVNRLYQLYQRNGRFSASIEPKIIQLDQNRVNLVFEISEGAVTTIESVRFVGNHHFDDDKLRGVVSSKESRWYKFWSADDRYDPDRVSYDEELLRKFYLSQGYVDFNIVSSSAELSSNKKNFFLTITVDEGERYRVHDVLVNSALRNFDASVLRPHITVQPGDWYDADEVRTTIDNITNVLGDMQFAFVNVRPDITRNREDMTVDLRLDIEEAPRVFVERIDIHGNVRTLDKVIRREMLLAEGDPFNRSKLAKSEQQIKNLGFFENVTVTPSQGSAPDKSVVDIGVTEQSTGELSLGAGYSTTDGPLADIRIRERNLLGKGQDLTLATTIAGKRTEFDFSFTEPYFLNRDFSAGIDLYHITRDLQSESSYDQKRTGGSLRFGYPLSEKWRQTLSYNLEQNEIDNVQTGASIFIREQEGKRVTSSVAHHTTYDDRDSLLQTTEGLFWWLDNEMAGVGGDAKFFSGKTGLSYFYPVADRWVLNLIGETGGITGWGDEDVKINDRYFLGGSTLRGFASGGIGPRDLDTNDALGGNLFYRGSVEMTFPLGLPEDMGIKGHGFTDFGSLWDLDSRPSPSVVDDSAIRAAAGVGVSWRSPLGPIRVDVATPYMQKDYDKTEVFRFNFGTRF